MQNREKFQPSPEQLTQPTVRVAKRFYSKDVPAMLAQASLSAELVHPIAEFRRNIHILNTFRNTFVRLSEQERAYLFAECLPRLLPTTHSTLWRQQVGDDSYEIPGDEYFADIPPAAMERVLTTLRSYDLRKQQLWPLLLFDLDREKIPNQTYSNQDYFDIATTLYMQYSALQEQLSTTIPNCGTPQVANQRILRWQDRTLAEQIRILSNISLEEGLHATPEKTIQTAVLPLINDIHNWLEYFMKSDHQQLAKMLVEKIGTTNPNNKKAEYILNHKLSETKEDIAYLLLPRELRETLLSFYGFTRLVKPSNDGNSGYEVAQNLYSIRAVLRSLTPSEK